MPNQELQKIIDSLKTKQFREGEAKGLLSAIQEEQTKALQPVLEQMAKEMGEKMTKAMIEQWAEAIKSIKVEVPEIQAPSVEVPPIDTRSIENAIMQSISKLRISSPAVNVPPISIPEIIFPNEMQTRGWAEMMLNGKPVGLDNALPVTLRDKDGRPVDFSRLGGAAVAGGRGDFFTIAGFSASALADYQNADGRLRVSVETGGSGLTDSELRASAVPVAQVSGAGWSVSVVDIFASTGANVINPDGRIKVELPSGASGLTDTELRAAHLDVQQVSGSTDSVNIVQTVTLDVKQLSGSIDSVYVSGVAASFFSDIQNPDGRVKVELPSGSSGLTDAELRASHLDVQQLSGAVDSVFVTGFGASVGASLLNGDGTSLDPRDRNWSITESLNVNQVSGAMWSVAVEAQDVTLDVKQVSGSADSVVVNDFLVTVPVYQVSGAAFSVNNVGPIANGDEATALRVVHAGNATASVNVVGPINQGDAATALRVVVAGNSDASVVVNSGTLTGITNTIDVRQVSGAGWSVVVTGSTGTTAVTGTVAPDSADDGAPPVKTGGVARTANPTAVGAGDMVSFTADDLGRQLMRPVQVRDLIKTAYVSITNGTETTLLAGVAGAFLDCIMITASNNSDAAVSVDIRNVTAGNVIHTLRIPANSTAGWAPSVPWPQDATGNNWTVDGPDETGRTLTFSALFSQEV